MEPDKHNWKFTAILIILMVLMAFLGGPTQ